MTSGARATGLALLLLAAVALLIMLPGPTGPTNVAAQAPAAPECMTADADGAYEAPFDWALKPTDLARGEQFRLLFITSQQRLPDSRVLSTYDTFVQGSAKLGHAAIGDDCAALFKVVGSNDVTDARDHTATTVTATDTGVPIYWLNGARLADDYTDFYDGAWADYGMTEQNGNRVSYAWVFTGSNDDGTKARNNPVDHTLGTNYRDLANFIDERVRTGDPSGAGSPLSSGYAFDDVPGRFYALSPVFTVEKPTIGFGETEVTVNEGGTLNLKVALSHPRSEDTSFTVITTDLSANANADYTPGPHNGSIPAGQTETTVSIAILNDTTAESKERFIATIAGPPDGVTVPDETKTSTITIVDDDGTGRLVITPAAPLELTEGGSGTYTVELASAPTHDVTVTIASNDLDVTTNPATLTFMPGNWSAAQTVTVNSMADYDIWDDTATLTHTTTSDDVNYAGSASFATKRVDVPDSIIAFPESKVSFKDASMVVVEDVGARGDPRYAGEVGINLVLSRYIVGSGWVTITATSGTDGTATAGEDFRSVTHRAYIPSNVTETTVYFNLILDDNKLENDETFTLTLSDSSRVTLGDLTTMTVTIEDNEYRVSVASGLQTTSVNEGDGHAEVKFKLQGPDQKPRALRRQIGVDFRYPQRILSNAKPGRDYLPIRQVNVPPGQTEFTLRIPIIDDDVPEASSITGQAFEVIVWPRHVPQDGGYGQYGGSGNATNFRHNISIKDNDGAEGIEVSPNPTTLFEGQTRTITIEHVPYNFGTIHTTQPERNFYFITDNANYPFTTTTNRNPDQQCADWRDYNSDGVDICINAFHWNADERIASIQLTALRDRAIEGEEHVYMRFGKWLNFGADTHVFKITVTDSATEYQEHYSEWHDSFSCYAHSPTVTDIFPGRNWRELTEAEKEHFLDVLGYTRQVFSPPPVMVAEWDEPSYEVGDTATIKFSAQDEAGNPKRACASLRIRYEIIPHPVLNRGVQGPIYQDPTAVLPRYTTIRPGNTEAEASFTVQKEGTATFRVTGAGTTALGGSHLPVRKLKDGEGNDLPSAGLSATVVQNAPPPLPEVSVVGSFSGDESNQIGFDLRADPAPAAGETLDVSVTITAEGDFGVPTGTRTITIGSTGYGELVLDAEDDQIDEPDGSVTLTINPGDDYTLGLFSTRTTPVEDNDGPDDQAREGNPVPETQDEEETSQPPLEKYADLIERIKTDMQGPNYEGEEHDLKRVLKTLGVSQYADYDGGPVGVQEATNRRTKPNDNPHWEGIAEAIQYKLDYDAGTVNPPPASDPVITISGGSGITEGGTASFTISASPVPDSAITVNVGVSQTSDFGASGPATVSVSGATTTYTVSTGDDQVDEADGSVTATVQSGSGYTVGTASTATVTVADDDAPPPDPDPVITISGGSGITEGGSATFTISASPAPTSAITVNIGVSESGDWDATGAATLSVNSATTTYTIATGDDQVDEADGSVTATVQAGSGYTVGTASTATVTVADDDDPPATPEITISGGSGITEGGTASFTISASPVPSGAITVNIGVSESGDWDATGAATLSVNSATTTYTIATGDDQVDEANGSVTATVQAGSGYTVGTASTATVAVADDDDPPATPEITISGGSGITEGGSATFTISASPAPTSAITVNIGVSETGDWDATGAATVSVNSATTTYTIATSDDQVDEADGSVTATVQSGTGYTVGTASTATVAVADDDDPPATPEITISGGSGITEGGPATFTISASPAPTSAITVNVGVSETGDWDATGAATVSVNSATTTYTIATGDDQVDEADGSVTATVQSGAGYTVGTASTATVAVADDDDPVEEKSVTISIEDASASESASDLVFKVTLSEASDEDITVQWRTLASNDPDRRARGGKDYWDMSGEIRIRAGETSGTGAVWLEQDSEDEPDELFTVYLYSPAGATLGREEGTMTIIDDD